MGRYEPASQAFERSAAVNPEDGGVYYDAALAYLRLNNRGRARACLKRALDLRPDLKTHLSADQALNELL